MGLLLSLLPTQVCRSSLNVPSRSQRGIREVGLLAVSFGKNLGSGPVPVCVLGLG